MRPATFEQGPPLESVLEIVEVESGKRRIIFVTRDHIEAPNWSRDGQYLLFNRSIMAPGGGTLHRIDIGQFFAGTPVGEPVFVETGLNSCNNDHGFSPDGTKLAVSMQSDPGFASRVFLLPAAGGTDPTLLTPEAPSYWHGWSPDGKTIAYVGKRDGEYDIYTRPITGGAEIRLTDSPGLNDGPDYSPDGRHIFFNSLRTGNMKIWRMDADGANPVQLTFEKEYRDWFPHPSPDGRWLVFLSFGEGVPPAEHGVLDDVVLRLMPAGGGEPHVLARLYGGQGTINVPSWSPDGRHVAFISFRARSRANHADMGDFA